jgi:hypothetical protein
LGSQANQDVAPGDRTVHDRGPMVCNLAQRLGFLPDEPQLRAGGPQPSVEAGVSTGQAERSVPGAGRSARAQTRQNSPIALNLAPGRDPVGEERS